MIAGEHTSSARMFIVAMIATLAFLHLILLVDLPELYHSLF